MANKVILQDAENGKVDILVKEPGYHADHYLRVEKHEVDHWAREAGAGKTGVELVDLRK